MIPHDLPSEEIALPPGPRDSAALITGAGLRHARLGYLLQQRFPGLLKAWWMHDPPSPTTTSPPRPAPVPNWRQSTGTWWRGARRALANALDPDLRRDLLRLDRDAVERAMFANEVAALRAAAPLAPTRVPDVLAPPVVDAMAELRPYFLLVCGGPLLQEKVLTHVRGVALNQHAGHAPELRGAETIAAALYHRRLDWVAATVHMISPHADAGAILRRSATAVHPDDTAEHCFLASVALGTELLLSVLAEALRADRLTVYPQPMHGGTLLDWQLRRKLPWLARDLASGWLRVGLRDQQDW